MDNFNLKSVFPPTMIENETVINKVFMQMFVDAILKNKDGLTQSNKDIGLISEILANVKEGFESHIANHPSGGIEYVHPETHPASIITGLSNVATSGNYSDLKGLPAIPTVTNDLTNALKSNYDNAYTHSNSTHAPSNAQRNADITKAEIEAKLTGAISTHTHNYASTSHGHADKVDKSKYDADIKALTDEVNTLKELVNGILNPPLPSFLGLITFKELNSIQMSDLTGLETDQLAKPQTIYTHSTGSTGNKALVLAFPKSFGIITGIVDGAGVNIMGNSYNFTEKTFNINGKNVQYIVSSTNEASLFNNSVVIKWNIS